MDRCDSPKFFSQRSCLDDVCNDAGTDGLIIDHHMRDSGGEKGNNKNTSLDTAIIEIEDTGVINHGAFHLR